MQTRLIKLLLPALVVALTAPLAFAVGPATATTVRLPKSGVEKPAAATVSELGSTLLYPLWNIWAPAYSQSYSQVTLTTAGGGSGEGISSAANGTVDIGSSDAYLPQSDVTATPTLLNIPLAISVQVIEYNLPGITAHLKLNGKVLSAIYQGQITTWNDSAIASLNPGITLPPTPIVPLRRSDGSGDSFIFTQYLSDQDPSGWGTKYSYNTAWTGPAVTGELAENGNGGMVSACKTTTGCIAYVGISYLSQVLGDGQTYAQLENGDGQYELPTMAAVSAEAAAFVKKTPANETLSLVDGKVSGGYPIINYEYAIVNSSQSSSSTAKAIRSVLEWAVNAKDGNSATYLGQVNFQPLPAAIAAKSIKQIEKIS